MMKSKMANRYLGPRSAHRAVRMVFEASRLLRNAGGAIAAIAAKIGSIPQTLREWSEQAEKDSGMRDSMTLRNVTGSKPWNVRFVSCATQITQDRAVAGCQAPWRVRSPGSAGACHGALAGGPILQCVIRWRLGFSGAALAEGR